MKLSTRSLTEQEKSRISTFLGRSRLFFAVAVVLAAASAALGSSVVAESEGSDAAIGGTLCFVLAGLWAFSAIAIHAKLRLLRDDLANGTVERSEESVAKTQVVKGKVVSVTISGRRLVTAEGLAGPIEVAVGDTADISRLPLSGYILELKQIRK